LAAADIRQQSGVSSHCRARTTPRDAGLQKDKFTDMDQLPGDKTGQSATKRDQFKPIRIKPPSDGGRRQAAFAVHH
jgi:hypothetical protein